MEIILDFEEKELKNKMAELGLKPFRANQVLTALYDGKKLEEISTISKNEKQIIAQNFQYNATEIYKVQTSKDGTQKFALKLFDDNIIEAVVMKYKYGNTICVSTQVGCRMGCKFCASTIGGLVRNLSAGEILGQVQVINNFLGGNLANRKITNVVLMGCGEPLDNYANVVKFLKLVNNEKWLGISQRNISLSTCGLVDKIYQLADDGFKINLTISLHSSNDEERKKIMPIANKFSIKEIITACDYYFEKNARRIYFEYTLCKGINDKEKNIQELKTLLKGKVCHINVITLNEVSERTLKAVERKEAEVFVQKLCDAGLSATLRRTLGEDIDGACGQLRKRLVEEKS